MDLVIIAVKLWDTREAARAIAPLVARGAAVVSFQNGVEKDDVLRSEFGGAPVIGGVGYISAILAEPGVVAHTGKMQRLVFGEYDGRRSARAEAFLEACRLAEIDAELSDDIRRVIWEKFVFLVGLSGATATMRAPTVLFAPTRGRAPFSWTPCAKSLRSVGRKAYARRGLRRKSPRFLRRPSGGDGFFDARRPHARASAGIALAERRSRKTRRGNICSDPGKPSDRRYLGPLRRRAKRKVVTPPRLTIRSARATAVAAPMARPLGTSAQTISAAPLLLIDLETEEGVTGRSYLFCYVGMAAAAIARVLDDAVEASPATDWHRWTWRRSSPGATG